MTRWSNAADTRRKTLLQRFTGGKNSKQDLQDLPEEWPEDMGPANSRNRATMA